MATLNGDILQDLFKDLKPKYIKSFTPIKKEANRLARDHNLHIYPGSAQYIEDYVIFTLNIKDTSPYIETYYNNPDYEFTRNLITQD